MAGEISDMLIDLSNAEVKRMAQDKEKEVQEKEEAQAGKNAIRLMYSKTCNFRIPIETIIQNQSVQECLEQQCTFLVLNTDYKEKFKGLCNEYRSFKEELKSKQFIGKEEFDKLSKLNDELDRLSKNFVQREHKENEPVRKLDDEAINKLKSHVIAEIKQARAAAEQERKALIEEKNVVEEIVMQLQRLDSARTQAPSSAFNNVTHEPVAGPSWRI